MHDRMCELRPAGATAGSGGIGNTGDVGRGTTTSSTNECNSGGRPSDTAAAKVRKRAIFVSTTSVLSCPERGKMTAAVVKRTPSRLPRGLLFSLRIDTSQKRRPAPREAQVPLKRRHDADHEDTKAVSAH